MSDSLMRQIFILKRIPRYPRFVSTSQLKDSLLFDEFEVQIRTIQRDLERLSNKFCLTYERLKGWSYTGEPIVLPPLI